MSHVISSCTRELNVIDSDEDDHAPNWRELSAANASNSCSQQTDCAFRYKSSLEIESLPFWGQLGKPILNLFIL